MARGRVITPDFWTDGNMVGVSAFARLFYIGMWNFAHCDKGHLDDDAMGLKLKILPADQVDAHGLLSELVGCGRITRIRAANGKSYLAMPSFERHQKTDVRWKTRCPACALINSGELTETPESFPERTETHPASALREEKRTELERTEEKKNSSSPPAMVRSFHPIYNFDDFWATWPRKEGKVDARKAWDKATRKHPQDSIVDAARAYAEHPDRPAKQFVPHATTWLNGERWNDGPPTAPEERSNKPTPEQRARQTMALAMDIDMKEIGR